MKAWPEHLKRNSSGAGPHPVGFSPAGERKWVAALVISLCLNVVLGGAAAFYLARKPSASPAQPAVVMQASLSTAPVEDGATTNSVATLSLATNRFHWRRVESEDYPTYLANLRAVGCPEETIRDILLADIEKLYGTKAATLPIYAGFWSCGPKRQAAERARAQRQSTLEQEKAALVQHLLGVPYVPEDWKHDEDFKEQALISFVVGPVPDGVATQVVAAMERGENAVREIRDQASGILLPGEEKHIQESQEQTVAQLKRLLTPEQFEEFGARAAALHIMGGDSENFRLSAAECRGVACIHASVFGMLGREPFHLFDGWEETPAQTEELESRLKAFLGEARFAEYQRERDTDFKHVRSVAEEQQLPREAAIKVYEIKQLVKAEQDRLERAEPGAERAAQWRQVQEATRIEVRRLLGDKAFEVYLNRGGQWLTNSPNL